MQKKWRRLWNYSCVSRQVVPLSRNRSSLCDLKPQADNSWKRKWMNCTSFWQGKVFLQATVAKDRAESVYIPCLVVFLLPVTSPDELRKEWYWESVDDFECRWIIEGFSGVHEAYCIQVFWKTVSKYTFEFLYSVLNSFHSEALW